MNPLILDVETLTHQKGNPFSTKNKLVNVGFQCGEYSEIIYLDEPEAVQRIQTIIDGYEWLVGFNIKFDLHWLLNIGIKFNDKHKVWDCQLYEYSKYYQRRKYISLQDTCLTYGLEGKLDVVKLEYWDKGVDTDQIPREILSDYLIQDLVSTEEVFCQQFAERDGGQRPRWFTTFRRDCCDLWSVIEMERAGSLLDVKGVEVELEKQTARKVELEEQILRSADGVPLNLGSGDHLSCLLYGGTIVEEQRVPVGVYKTGERVGQPRYSVFKYEHVLPRLYEPAPKSELKKEGYWSTSEDNLLRIKTPKKTRGLLDAIIEVGKIDKLIGSYLVKMPKMLQEYSWEDNLLRGTYNHGVTMTGRLASDKPNLQNAPPILKKYFISRFT